MIKKYLLVAYLMCSSLINGQDLSQKWITENHNGFKLNYQEVDKGDKEEYIKLIKTGIASVQSFFNDLFKLRFDVFIYPDRKAMDVQWQKNWNIPDFKSECWMVASGVAKRLDLLSPRIWVTESCEHNYLDKLKTQQLITHELVHVYHGQLNSSPDFSDVTDIDWFVEGLATYASGQCDSLRINDVKKEVKSNKIPGSFNLFWTRKLRYGLSGTVVMYIDYKYGREKLKSLLRFNRKVDILKSLSITESELLAEWEKFMKRV
jgi:hypothetical protein